MTICWGAYGDDVGAFFVAVGTPSDEEIGECRSLGRRAAKLVKHLFA